MTQLKELTSDQYAPRKEDKFTFGLWTVGNRGRDPFGYETRPDITPVQIVRKLGFRSHHDLIIFAIRAGIITLSNIG